MPLRPPALRPTEGDRPTGQAQQRHADPCADHHAHLAPGGVKREAEGIGPVFNDIMLGRDGVRQQSRRQHQRRREPDFDGDPLSQSSSSGRRPSRTLAECRQPDEARARGDHENHRE